MAYRWIVLISGALAYTTSFFARTSYTGIAKFIAADLHLDKSDLGLMGSAFFYAYALSQFPWGVASDKFGSRTVVTVGVLATAGTLWGFSTSGSAAALNLWRALNGVAAAGLYVSMSGAISRWFSPQERALSNGLFVGLGGGAGEGTSTVILPALVAMSFTWRSATTILAAVVAAIGVLCALTLRSAPPGAPHVERRPFNRSILRDLRLWGNTAIYSGSIIAIRIISPWLPVYATDIYVSRGMDVRQAALRGGLLSTFYLVGRLFGVPMAGFLSDRLIGRGIGRQLLAVAFLFLTVVVLCMMPIGIDSTSILGAMACLLGASINMYPLITTAVSEIFGAERTSSAMGVVNMVAQFSGALALSTSGYVGIALSTRGNILDEYRGIWLVGVVGCLVSAGAGLALSHVAKRRQAVESSRQPFPSR
jgi:sugar phosphate permease